MGVIMGQEQEVYGRYVWCAKMNQDVLEAGMNFMFRIYNWRSVLDT